MEWNRVVRSWFEKWEEGDYRGIPVTDDFTHTSPYGIVEGKERYLSLVQANEDAFLGFRFEIHDELYGPTSACVRYTAHSGDVGLEVSEWFFGDEHGIARIVSYYNVGGDASYSSFAGEEE